MNILSLILLLLVLVPNISMAGDRTGKTPDSGADPIPPDPLEEGVAQAEVAGIARHDFVAQFSGDTLFLPYLSLCDFLRIPAGISSDNSTLEGSFPSDQHFEFSRRSNTATRGRDTVSFPAAQIRLVGGELYIEQSLFFRVLGIQANFRISKLTLLIAQDERLPVVQWSRNHQRYASLLLDKTSPGDPVPEISVNRSLIGAPMIDWTISNNLNSRNNLSNASVGIGGELLFGEAEINTSAIMRRGAFGAQTPLVALNSWTWRFIAPEYSPLRKVTIGRIPVAGTQMYAAEISNVPIIPRGGFMEHEIQGQTRPGWTVELYDGTHLADVTRADSLGYYSFTVPVGYGTIERLLRFVGPYGEILTEERRVQVDGHVIPSGELDYTVRGGSERLAAGSRIGGEGRVDFGLLSRLTVGVDGLLRPSAYGAITADSVSASTFATIWMGESSTLGLRYRPLSRLFSGEISSVTPGNRSFRLSVDSLSLRDRSFISTVSANIPLGQVSIGGAGRVEHRGNGYFVTATPQISGYLAGVTAFLSTTFARAVGGGGGGEIDSAGRSGGVQSVFRLIATPLRGTLVSIGGTYDYRTRSLPLLDMTGYLRLTGFMGISVGYSVPNLQWSRGAITAQLELNFAPARIFAFADHQAGTAATTSTMFAQGSVAFTGNGVLLSPDYALGRSAVVVRAFRDRNGNGVRDDGEEDLPAPHARLRQGNTELTAEEGEFPLLTPNMVWVLDVDRWDYAPEGLFPSHLRYGVFSSPGAAVAVDVPYVEGGDVAGRCLVAADSVAGETAGGHLNGLRVQLAAVSGSALYDGEVFADGTMLITGVAAGEYRVEFDRAQLASRRLARVAPEEIISIGGESSRHPVIRLRRAE
ncbi:MAG: hypothetical protein JWQ98_1981 [Chlorobi bacterium]|nr:hypothetical protein [Chlorobiota bacterium]